MFKIPQIFFVCFCMHDPSGHSLPLRACNKRLEQNIVYNLKVSVQSEQWAIHSNRISEDSDSEVCKLPLQISYLHTANQKAKNWDRSLLASILCIPPYRAKILSPSPSSQAHSFNFSGSLIFAAQKMAWNNNKWYLFLSFYFVLFYYPLWKINIFYYSLVEQFLKADI